MLKYVFLIFTSYIGKSIFILWISFIWWCNEYKHINLFGQFLTLSLQGCHRGSLSMEGLPKWAMSGSLNITSITGDVMIYYVETTWYISYISVRAYPIPLWLYFLKNPTQRYTKNLQTIFPNTLQKPLLRFFIVFFSPGFCHLACCSSCPTNDFCGLLWPPPLNS